MKLDAPRNCGFYVAVRKELIYCNTFHKLRRRLDGLGRAAKNPGARRPFLSESTKTAEGSRFFASRSRRRGEVIEGSSVTPIGCFKFLRANSRRQIFGLPTISWAVVVKVEPQFWLGSAPRKPISSWMTGYHCGGDRERAAGPRGWSDAAPPSRPSPQCAAAILCATASLNFLPVQPTPSQQAT